MFTKIKYVANDSLANSCSSAPRYKLGDKSPHLVKIETPKKISKVTQDMYRNAAQKRWVEHAKITVAAPIPVTGERVLWLGSTIR